MEEGGGPNRLFLILAISLVGLLVLGLLGVGGVFVIRQNLQGQEVASRPTPTLIIRLPNPTATPTPLRMNPTDTPAPTPTNTPVISPGSGEEAAVGGGQAKNTPAPQPSPTRTPLPAAETASTTVVPETGAGGLELVLAAAGLIAVFFIARRLRMAA